MAFHPITFPVTRFITFVTLLESIVWFVSCISLFFLHERIGGLDPESEGYFFDVLNNLFYILYLKVDEGGVNVRNVNEKEFFIFIVVYMLVSLAWMIISGYQYWHLKRAKLSNIRNIFISWIVVTSIISLIDLIFGILMSNDYNSMSIEPAHDYIFSANIVVFLLVLIAFRGFVLWILNIIYVGVVTYFIYYMMKKENESTTNDQGPIQAFDPTSRPSWFAEAVNDEEAMPRMVHVDQAFIDVGDPNQYQDGNRSLYSQRTDTASVHMGNGFEPRTPQSGYQGSNSSLFHYPMNHRSAPTTPEPNYAKIGKKGRKPNATSYKTAPPVVPLFPPYIPPPDYTPPASPVLRARSVLKNNPIY